MKHLIAAAALVALPLAASAQDLTTAFIGKHITIIRPDNKPPVTLLLQPQGVAQHIAENGRTLTGTWAIEGDRLCANFPDRHQMCVKPADQLAATGHITMTNKQGEQINVTAQ